MGSILLYKLKSIGAKLSVSGAIIGLGGGYYGTRMMSKVAEDFLPEEMVLIRIVVIHSSNLHDNLSCSSSSASDQLVGSFSFRPKGHPGNGRGVERPHRDSNTGSWLRKPL